MRDADLWLRQRSHPPPRAAYVSRAATLYSLTRTCAQYRVPPVPDFTEVLQHLATREVGTLDDLLPHRWHARHAPEAGHPLDSS